MDEKYILVLWSSSYNNNNNYYYYYFINLPKRNNYEYGFQSFLLALFSWMLGQKQPVNHYW